MNYFRKVAIAKRWEFWYLLTKQNLRRLLNSSELHVDRLLGRSLSIQIVVRVDAVAVRMVVKSLMLSIRQLDYHTNVVVPKWKLN
jgi:hypothetical protein